jgi:Rod binding domain-containing protein
MPGAPVTAADTPTGADPTTAEKEQRIDGVARDLEAVLLYTLLKDMWSTLPKDSFFDSDLASKFYREMWLEEVAKRASQTGPGLGVAEAVKRELLDRAKREITPAELATRKG